MEVKGNTKTSECGIIPSDWNLKRIGDIASVGRGRVISHREISRSTDPRYPVYSSQTLNNGVMGFLDTYEFEGDYITWTTDGANAGTVFARSGRFNCTNVCGTIKLISDSNRFVARMLSGFTSRNVSRHLGNPKLMNDIMKQIVIPLPPTFREQEAIAEGLSDADAYIESLEQLLAKKRDIKQGVMQELLTGQRRLPGFTEPWKNVQLGNIAVLKNGYAFKSSSYEQSGIFNIVTISNVQDGFMDVNHFSKLAIIPADVQRHQLLEFDDILISMTGNVGRVCRVDLGHCLLNQRVGKIVPYDINRNFLFQSLKQKTFAISMMAKATGGAQGNLKSSHILENNVLCPSSVDEQQQISSILDTMDLEITVLQSKVEKSHDIKQGMVQELLTGRTRLV